MTMRKKLTEILRGSNEILKKSWETTKAAAEFAPLPAGEYIAHISNGELSSAKAGTPGYKLTFTVAEGEFAGRRFWHDLWLTEAALPMSKRDLGKLGVTALEQLDQPLPHGIRCRVKLALRKDDNRNEHNRVVTFTVIGIDVSEADPFAPTETPKGGQAQ